MMTSSAESVPTLGRFLPMAALLTVVVYGLVFGAFLFSPASEGGGGGEVLGRLNISLGGTGDVGPVDQNDVTPSENEPNVMPNVVPPEPRTLPEMPEAPPIVQKPRVAPSTPVKRQPVETPRAVEQVNPVTETYATSGDGGDGRPVGAVSQGAQTIGEGVPMDSAGLGARDANLGNDRDAYLALIRARIEKNRSYPSAARRERAEGRVLVQITVNSEGELDRSEILTGSGSFHLDRAARRMVEKSAPFPPPPHAPFTESIPIDFSLM